jgi:hypothetical protein
MITDIRERPYHFACAILLILFVAISWKYGKLRIEYIKAEKQKFEYLKENCKLKAEIENGRDSMIESF